MNPVQRYVQLRKRTQKPEYTPEEQRALDKIKSEASQHGATLHSGGKGGLPPSVVLGVFRRDKWKCQYCGSSKDLDVHHIGGAKNLVVKAFRKMGHSESPKNLVTICRAEHDIVHDLDRKAEGR